MGMVNVAIDPVNCAGADPEIRVLWGTLSSDPGWGNDSRGEPHFNDENNHSVVVRVDFGESSVLLTGDLEDVAIDTLLEQFDDEDLLDVDVYQVGHHGSKNGTASALVEEMTPEMAVISMGPADRMVPWTAWDYGHPNAGIVRMIEDSITRSREPQTVMVGHGKRTFEEHLVTRALYATGWDGTVVLEGNLVGEWTVISPSETSSLININSATAEELERLPGIGPAKARDIIAYRDQHGDFGSVEALDDVRGIGPVTLAKIRALVTAL
ncbi:MAG: hypothetical protein HN341_16465, partial [Verrucomicrobia bacterium]|nr:hypothetical protein [Verrucomicrobiota bacterium]